MTTPTTTEDRAWIYDYRTGDVVRRAMAAEEHRYILEVLDMPGHARMVGAADAPEDLEDMLTAYIERDILLLMAGVGKQVQEDE